MAILPSMLYSVRVRKTSRRLMVGFDYISSRIEVLRTQPNGSDGEFTSARPTSDLGRLRSQAVLRISTFAVSACVPMPYRAGRARRSGPPSEGAENAAGCAVHRSPV